MTSIRRSEHWIYEVSGKLGKLSTFSNSIEVQEKEVKLYKTQLWKCMQPASVTMDPTPMSSSNHASEHLGENIVCTEYYRLIFLLAPK